VRGYVDKKGGSTKCFHVHMETRHKINVRKRSHDANDDTPNHSSGTVGSQSQNYKR